MQLGRVAVLRDGVLDAPGKPRWSAVAKRARRSPKEFNDPPAKKRIHRRLRSELIGGVKCLINWACREGRKSGVVEARV